MNLDILKALLRKEVLLIRRNSLYLKIIIIMPVMVMLVAPLITTMDVKNVGVAAVDLDKSMLSERMLADMQASPYLTINHAGNYAGALKMIEEGQADVIVVIPVHFSRDLSNISIETNGVNALKGNLGGRYVGQSISGSLSEWMKEQGRPLLSSSISVLNRFNPTLDFRNYMIPALMIMLLIVICGFLPTLNMVSEKEKGTIEAMNVSPVGRFTFMLSKLIPFWVAGLIVISVGMFIGYLVYGLAPLGSIGSIYLAAIFFILFMSGLGVLVANNSANMLQSIFVMFAIIMILQLMGGIFTPVSSMPEWAQFLTFFIPPRYFNEIIRAIYLKGSTIGDLWYLYGALGTLAAFVCILAVVTYRKKN